MSDIRQSAGSFDLVVACASLGGLEALSEVLGALPTDFAAPVLVVQHRHPGADFVGEILRRRTALDVARPFDGELPSPGVVYVMPAGRQVLLDRDGAFVSVAAARCSADPLLQSASFVHRERLIAAVLTGRLRDGADGVAAVKAAGGRVLAQDPGTSRAFGMPGAAIATGCVDFVLPVSKIAPALVALVMVPGAADLFSVRLSPWAAARPAQTSPAVV